MRPTTLINQEKYYEQIPHSGTTPANKTLIK